MTKILNKSSTQSPTKYFKAKLNHHCNDHLCSHCTCNSCNINDEEKVNTFCRENCKNCRCCSNFEKLEKTESNIISFKK